MYSWDYPNFHKTAIEIFLLSIRKVAKHTYFEMANAIGIDVETLMLIEQGDADMPKEIENRLINAYPEMITEQDVENAIENTRIMREIHQDIDNSFNKYMQDFWEHQASKKQSLWDKIKQLF